MNYYDKDEIKNNLSIEEVKDLVTELQGEPINKGSYLICRTICHNHPGEGSHKLYYYDNTKLFRCYTECEKDIFDIFELVCKVKALEGEEWQLYDAVCYVAEFFDIKQNHQDFSSSHNKLPDWKILDKYAENSNKNQEKKIVELKKWDITFLNNLPQPKILPWLREGISENVMKSHHIYYDPKSHGIVIPHYDMDGNLIGIRERTLVKDNEDKGKYRPAILDGTMFNHPLGFSLYNLNNSKEQIKILKTVIVFESEKSTLLYGSYFGEENDISVACCGSTLTQHQFDLLLSLGIKELIIGFDRQYKDIGDDEWRRWTKKLYGIHDKYGGYVKISYLFDLEHRLDYKMSPIDAGKEIFLHLFDNRVYI